MFQSYEYKRCVDGLNLQLIDSDFVVAKPVDFDVPAIVEIYEFVIKTYESKELDVAANLIRAFANCCEQNKSASMSWLTDYCTKMSPMFSRYKDALEKYMVLL